MALLIEGPDMVGKTTLAHKIVEILREMGEPAGYFKFGMESRSRMTYDYLKNRIHPWTVIDRMHWSESIYAACTGIEPSLSVGEIARVDDHVIETCKGMLVVITANPNSYRDVVVPDTHSRGEDFSPETCLRVNGAYKFAVEDGRIPAKGHRFATVRRPGAEWSVSADSDRKISYPTDEFARTVAVKYAAQQRKLA